MSNTRVDGSVVVNPNGSVLIENHSSIGVDVSVNHGYLTMVESTVGNDVTLIQPIPAGLTPGIAPGDNFAAEICGSTIGNNLTIQHTPSGNDGVVIGASDLGKFGGCSDAGLANPGNTIGNNLSVLFNMSPVFIANNDIGHNVVCVANSPPPTYDPSNHANGSVVGQCTTTTATTIPTTATTFFLPPPPPVTGPPPDPTPTAPTVPKITTTVRPTTTTVPDPCAAGCG